MRSGHRQVTLPPWESGRLDCKKLKKGHADKPTGAHSTSVTVVENSQNFSRHSVS